MRERKRDLLQVKVVDTSECRSCLLTSPSSSPIVVRARRVFGEADDVEWAELQVPLVRNRRLYFSDPSYRLQWHLENIGLTDSPAGNDINVVPVWRQNITGKGVTVAMVDDGLDFAHPDLFANYVRTSSLPLPMNHSDVGVVGFFFSLAFVEPRGKLRLQLWRF